jgi:imidazolonepropionase-like amidohydrolase
MRKTIYLLLLFLPLNLHAQEDNAPVIGVSDRRGETYGFKNARVVVDYQTTLENSDILIHEGRIEAVGKNLTFPSGTVVIDLTGKTVYPSFVDVYAANFGIKVQTSGTDLNPYAAMRNP